MFLLRPAPLIKQFFEYCLAYAVQKYSVNIHGYCVMSNHYHLVLTDTNGNLPAFMSWFNEFLAKAFNALHGRWENFWAPGSYSMVHLQTPQDTLDKIMYTIINPVRAGLVSRARHWPGAHSVSMRFGVQVSLERPKHFFRSKGPMPKKVTFTLERPSGFEVLTDEEWQDLVRERLAESEKEIGQECNQEGRSFMGSRVALNIRPTDSPSTRAPRRARNPMVAARDKSIRIQAIEQLKLFRLAYRQAFSQWKAGNLNAVFPYGTYALRDIVQVQAIPPP
ncbi:MAG: hypothetical protein GXP54_05195 [Deltaproteobacteria bacterium]|nr:hypothetical protein [Deltaproteobacteria bacterium]